MIPSDVEEVPLNSIVERPDPDESEYLDSHLSRTEKNKHRHAVRSLSLKALFDSKILKETTMVYLQFAGYSQTFSLLKDSNILECTRTGEKFTRPCEVFAKVFPDKKREPGYNMSWKNFKVKEGKKLISLLELKSKLDFTTGPPKIKIEPGTTTSDGRNPPSQTHRSFLNGEETVIGVSDLDIYLNPNYNLKKRSMDASKEKGALDFSTEDQLQDQINELLKKQKRENNKKDETVQQLQFLLETESTRRRHCEIECQHLTEQLQVNKAMIEKLNRVSQEHQLDQKEKEAIISHLNEYIKTEEQRQRQYEKTYQNLQEQVKIKDTALEKLEITKILLEESEEKYLKRIDYLMEHLQDVNEKIKERENVNSQKVEELKTLLGEREAEIKQLQKKEEDLEKQLQEQNDGLVLSDEPIDFSSDEVTSPSSNPPETFHNYPSFTIKLRLPANKTKLDSEVAMEILPFILGLDQYQNKIFDAPDKIKSCCGFLKADFRVVKTTPDHIMNTLKQILVEDESYVSIYLKKASRYFSLFKKDEKLYGHYVTLLHTKIQYEDQK